MELSFPIGPRPLLTPDLLDLVARRYDLGPVLIVSDVGGTYNLNAAIQTPRGTYIARVYRPWVTRPRLLGIQQLKQHLQAAQISVILPLLTTNGQTLIEYEQRLVEVEPFLPHDSVIQTVQHYQQRFEYLAQLHTALSQIDNLTAMPPPQVQNYALPKTLICWLNNTKHRIAERDHPRRQAALSVCEMAESLMYEVAAWWEQSGQSLPRQLIHGDYGLGNVLFVQDQIAAVVDWDFVTVHERVFDLAYALYWMCYDLARSTRNFERAWQWVQGMVACYQATNQSPLTMEELQALPTEMARVPLYWIGEATWLDDPVEAVLSHADQIGFASWLMGVDHHSPTAYRK